MSSICWTLSTPSMNSGNSSNCVHWSYAVRTGTLTSIDSSTRDPMRPLLCVGRLSLDASPVVRPRNLVWGRWYDRRSPLDWELDRDAKFGKEGLTFDDVLLLPAESARAAERRAHGARG